MLKNFLRFVLWSHVAMALGLPSALAQVFTAQDGTKIKVDAVVTNLDEPWAIGFLPGDAYLITERDGRLLLIEGETAKAVRGLPPVYAQGQGGLLDVVVARDYAQSREIFLTYAAPKGSGASTTLAVARLDQANGQLDNLRVLFQMNTRDRGGRHFGSRVVERLDGSLLVTTGDRGARSSAQDPTKDNGKVILAFRDGRPAQQFSLGHRNPQGAALDNQGQLWTVEHGAAGGDEINQPQPGRNYGWPIISYGTHYSGGKIGEGTAKPGMEQPAFFWDPSIAPSGLMIYSGKQFPGWRGQFFVGSLKFDMISRLAKDAGGQLREVERLLPGRFSRIRDVREAPDGSIWFLSVGDDAAYRMTPG